jgi:hypothetical protein
MKMEASNMSFSNSNPQPLAVGVARSRRNKVARIADKIVDLVERTSGPVFLHEIDQAVPGFKATRPRGHNYFISSNGKETVYWDGMSKAGRDALRCVLNDRRVAVQCVSALPYMVDRAGINDDNWQPIALLPIRAANIDTPTWAARVSPEVRQMTLSSGNGQFRPLTPQPTRFTADRFSIY